MAVPVGGRRTQVAEGWATEQLMIATGLSCKVVAGIEEAKEPKSAVEVVEERQQQLQEPIAVDVVAAAAAVVERRAEVAEVE